MYNTAAIQQHEIKVTYTVALLFVHNWHRLVNFAGRNRHCVFIYKCKFKKILCNPVDAN